MSESSRATAAAEIRNRDSAANFIPRMVKVVALDQQSEQLVEGLSTRDWPNARFLTASSVASAHSPVTDLPGDTWLYDLAGRPADLMEEVVTSDLMVLIASTCESALAVSVIGVACQLHGVTTTTLVVTSPCVSEGDVARTTSQLRPHSDMLVTTSSADYAGALLTALRA
jgi:hypothetical protein